MDYFPKNQVTLFLSFPEPLKENWDYSYLLLFNLKMSFSQEEERDCLSQTPVLKARSAQVLRKHQREGVSSYRGGCFAGDTTAALGNSAVCGLLTRGTEMSQGK